MQTFKTKDDVITYIQDIEQDIVKHAKEKSLATLEHKLRLRQQALEHLFGNFIAQINQNDLNLLREIQAQSQSLLNEMEEHKDQKGDEIIKYKNTGKRIRLYTDIAQQK